MNDLSDTVKEGILLVWPVTGGIEMAILASNILFLDKLCSCYRGGHAAEKRHLWFWQVLHASLISVQCIINKQSVNADLAKEGALWTFFQGDNNPLTMTLQSVIKLTKTSCNYSCIQPKFLLVFQKTLQKNSNYLIQV